MIKKIKLGTDNVSEEEYKKSRLKYIANYQEYNPGSFLSSGYYESKPDVASAKWDKDYPNGYKDWFDELKIPASFAVEAKDKINEIIDFLEKKKK